MGLAERVKAKYIHRIDELIARGISMPMKQHSRQTSYSMLSGESTYHHYQLASKPEFIEWRTSCIAVLDQVVPPHSLLRKTVSELGALGSEPEKLEFLVGFLRSVRKEVDEGSLDSLAIAIEAEILSDYLDQAVSVLAGGVDEPNHIAAAVIAGAALERGLRTICAAQVPPEPTVSERGSPFGMSALIESLKKRTVYNELQAKELRSWAALRNEAAHGHFSEFNRQQVEAMVAGVSRFLAEHAR